MKLLHGMTVDMKDGRLVAGCLCKTWEVSRPLLLDKPPTLLYRELEELFKKHLAACSKPAASGE